MNKFLTALIATACAGAMAQTVVYDYSSSIKRIQPEFKKVKASSKSVYGERYKVVSDKIFGYVVLPICKNCNASSNLTTTLDETIFTGTAYLTRNDSVLKKAVKAGDLDDGIFQVPVAVEAALFGSYVDITLQQATNKALDPKNAKQVWMSLSYQIPDAQETVTSNYLLKGTTAAIDYGFLGYTQNIGTTVYETGFGTATTNVTKATIDICGSTDGSSCTIINQVTGTITGWPQYNGPCGAMPMWDICAFDSNPTNQSVISGTWKLKFNKAATNAADQEDWILKKLKGYGSVYVSTVKPVAIPEQKQ